MERLQAMEVRDDLGFAPPQLTCLLPLRDIFSTSRFGTQMILTGNSKALKADPDRREGRIEEAAVSRGLDLGIGAVPV